MITHCPGAKQFRRPEPEELQCPRCGKELEIWTDEVKTRCPKCKKVIMREQDKPSCLDWCLYAKECVGDEAFSQYMKNKLLITKRRNQKAPGK